MIDSAEVGLSNGEDAVDWLRLHPGARPQDVLRLPTTPSSVDVALSDFVDVNPGFSLPPHLIDSMADWCAARCVRHERVLGSLQPLHRDFSKWQGSDPSFRRHKFVMGLAVIGIEVDSQFAKGMALREDVDSERLLSLP